MSPSKPKFVVYYRVSTQRQGRSGLGLEAQKASAQAFIESHNGIELAQFVEVESGRQNARPQLHKALLHCRQTRSALLVAKLDRLSRNAAFLLNLRDAGVKFQAIDLPDANTLTLGVMASMAQHEAEIISARTKAALAARKARGLPLGTPRDMSAHQRSASALGNAASRAKAQARAADIAPQMEAARKAGHVSLRQIAAYLNEQQIFTPRGKLWTATAVVNAQRMVEARAG